jgi:hypothetical protein
MGACCPRATPSQRGVEPFEQGLELGAQIHSLRTFLLQHPRTVTESIVTPRHRGHRAVPRRSVGDLGGDNARIRDAASVLEEVTPIEFLVPNEGMPRLYSLHL